MADGVSCEVCHGPAENYLAAHTMQGWSELGAARFEPRFGMKNTADIAARAQLCVGCHVGEPDAKGRPWRDVNHDLIAAGHPRLNFEFSAYMATLPPHWNTRTDPQRFDELRSWIVGQFTSSDAALRLLECRAKAAESKPAADAEPLVPPSWPELAEYDCFACHHELAGRSWRQDLGRAAAAGDRPARKPGAPAFGTWYYDGLRLMATTPALTPEAEARR